jgi:hypothetical protein
MTNFPWEDNLLERKVESDLKDLLKSLVAFANSVKPGHTAVILIGEEDNGNAQGVQNPDHIQNKVRTECEKIYPDILWKSLVYEKDGKYCVRVEIEYSGNTPHFGGPAWIRKGSSTIKASEEVFQKLIDLRNDDVLELSKWLNKAVSIRADQSDVPASRIDTVVGGKTMLRFTHPWHYIDEARIIDVNKYWVTFSLNNGNHMSESLSKLTLSFDDKKDRLLLLISYKA